MLFVDTNLGYTGHQAPERRETNELRLIIVPTYFKDGFQALDQGEQELRWKLYSLPEWKKRSWKSREARVASLLEKDLEERASQGKTPRGLQKVLSLKALGEY